MSERRIDVRGIEDLKCVHLIASRRTSHMSIVDDLIENLVERNAVRLKGTLGITLVDGGIRITGQVFSTLHDQKKNKDVLNVNIPVDAQLQVADVVIPLPKIQ
jgi:hypothetical protein